MIRAIVLLCALLSTGAASAAEFNWRPGKLHAQKMLEDGQLPELAVESYDHMFHVAAKMLEQKGEKAMADQLQGEWTGEFRGRLLAFGAFGDVGDHQAVSDWVEVWYALIEAKLGVQVMEWTHLRDIWVLNYTIKVVFKPHADEPWCTEQLQAHPEDTCEAEYNRHFTGTKYVQDPLATAYLHHGFSGVVTYWVVWGACEGATWGGGWFVICTPAGDLAEFAIEKWVAPKLAVKIYDHANQ